MWRIGRSGERGKVLWRALVDPTHPNVFHCEHLLVRHVVSTGRSETDFPIESEKSSVIEISNDSDRPVVLTSPTHPDFPIPKKIVRRSEKSSIYGMRRKMRELHGIEAQEQQYKATHHEQDNITSQRNTQQEDDAYHEIKETSNTNSLKTSTILAKYEDILTRPKDKMTEKVLETPYGYVRLDSYAEKPTKFADPDIDASDNEYFLESEPSSQNISLDWRRDEGVQEMNVVQDTQQDNAVQIADEDKSTSLFDDQYFCGIKDPPQKEKLNHHTPVEGVPFQTLIQQDISSRTDKKDKLTENCGGEIFEITEIKQNVPDYGSSSVIDSNLHTGEGLNYVDEQYFGSGPLQGEEPSSNTNVIGTLDSHSQDSLSQFVHQWSNTNESKEITKHKIHSEVGKTYKDTTSHEHVKNITADQTNYTLSKKGDTDRFSSDQKLDNSDVIIKTITKQEKRRLLGPKPDLENPKTAFDMAMKIRTDSKNKRTEENTSDAPSTRVKENEVSRKWKGKVDSHGFKILREQVTDVQRLSEDVVVKILRDSVLYEDDKIIAIDKPYGLPSHGGPGVHHSIGKLLDRFAHAVTPQKLETPHLDLIHRLDKETTGVMLLAKTHAAREELSLMFKKRKVTKRYWVITKAVPKPNEGIIDIPMAEGHVGDHYRMCLRPDYNPETKLLMKTAKSVNKQQAVTHYRVLDFNGSAALVECEPESGVKHQIRCHLAFGLNTPILGDHKYSHFSTLAPQKLYSDTLQRLGIRQATVRYLPMHLHARTVVLPGFLDGRNLFISARLPPHFVQNMKWLKLKPPKQ